MHVTHNESLPYGRKQGGTTEFTAASSLQKEGWAAFFALPVSSSSKM